jgi:type IV secretory pathway VirB10-like protein
MSRTSQSGLAAQKTPAPVPLPKSQFDTFETKFFEQGEAGHGADGERFEEWEEPTRSTHRTPTRQFLLGVAVGSISVAVLGGVGLWLVGVRLGRPAQASAPSPSEAMVVPVPAPPAAAAQPAAPPALPTPAPAPAAAEPSVAPAPPAPVAPAPPALAEKAEPAAAAPAEKPEPEPETMAQPAASPAVANCRKAMDRKRSKDVLAHCPAAFAAAPAADIAATLAKIEFDRGRGARALDWGKKAIALDATVAEAYVFIGGGEQMAGHEKAAKEAYRQYLELAPKGRYAADVRAIVGK